MENKNSLFLPAAILGISFIIGVVFFTNAWKSSQSANQTISVTGSAKKEIVSDLGFLRGTISVQSSTSESAFAELNRQKPILISYLERKGFPKDKIEFNTINSYPVYEMSEQGYQTGRVIGYQTRSPDEGFVGGCARHLHRLRADALRLWLSVWQVKPRRLSVRWNAQGQPKPFCQ